MTFKLASAGQLSAAVFIWCSLAVPVLAQNSPSYDGATHCAALNLAQAQALSVSDPATNKTQIQTHADQAAALMVLAAAQNGTGRDRVQADVFARLGALKAAIKGGGPGSDALNEEDILRCAAMGQAARRWLEQTLVEEAGKPV